MIRALTDWWHERGAPALILAVIFTMTFGAWAIGVAFIFGSLVKLLMGMAG